MEALIRFYAKLLPIPIVGDCARIAVNLGRWFKNWLANQNPELEQEVMSLKTVVVRQRLEIDLLRRRLTSLEAVVGANVVDTDSDTGPAPRLASTDC